MARARNIKPAFFLNDNLSELPPETRLLFIGLWCEADREGRISFRPKRIRAAIFPYESYDIESMLADLEKFGFIRVYDDGGDKFLQVENWTKHQRPHHKEIASVIPAPSDHTDTVCDGYIPLSGTIRARVYSENKNECNYCGAEENLEIDHILPISKGGNSVIENLQILCKPCNILKLNHIVNQEESIKQGMVVVNSTMSQEQVNEEVSCCTDTLNLIPDSLLLIPDPLNPLPESPTTETGLPEETMPSKLDGIAFNILDYLNSRTGKSFKPVASNLKLINARLKEGHTHNEVIMVIDRKCSEWMNDDKMKQYLRPSTLFNAEKFNAYVGELGVETPEQARERKLEDWVNGTTPQENVIEGEVLR